MARQFLTPTTPPYVEYNDGIKPPLGDDIRVFPCLPRKRSLQNNMNISGAEGYVVIEAGEPVAVYTDSSNRKWLVPASDTAYTLTYGSLDLDGSVENIDSTGNAVTAAGASSASIPALPPIGLATQPYRQNSKWTDASWAFGTEFQTEMKEVIVRKRAILIPYFRRGVNAIGRVNDGDLISVGSIYGNTLSATNRPKLVPTRMSGSVDNPTEATRGTAVITPTYANVATGDSFTLTVDGISITFTVAAAAATTAWNDIKFVKGANLQATVENLTAAINASALAQRCTATEDNSAVTVTATNYGANTALAYTEISDAGSGWSTAVTQGTNSTGRVHADEQYDSLNIAMIVGRCIRSWASLPGTFDLSKVVTPRLSGVSGTATNGVPQEMFFSGNTLEGSQYPSDYSKAGALMIALVL